MAESGKTVRILFPDGHERVFHNAIIETSVEGWLHVVRLELQEAPLSGVAEPIAGYRLDALLGWEYVQPDEQVRVAEDWFETGESAADEGDMAEMETVTESDIRYIQRDPTPEGVIYLHHRKSAAIVRHGQHVWKHAYLTGKRSVQAFCSASA